jgi:hypothetical protein
VVTQRKAHFGECPWLAARGIFLKVAGRSFGVPGHFRKSDSSLYRRSAQCFFVARSPLQRRKPAGAKSPRPSFEVAALKGRSSPLRRKQPSSLIGCNIPINQLPGHSLRSPDNCPSWFPKNYPRNCGGTTTRSRLKKSTTGPVFSQYKRAAPTRALVTITIRAGVVWSAGDNDTIFQLRRLTMLANETSRTAILAQFLPFQ